jgi:hypothetical protein
LLCILSVLACYRPPSVGKHINKGIESNKAIELESFSARKMNVLNYQYRPGNSFKLRTDFIKDLGVHINCKINFHCHVNFIFSLALKLLGLIRTITFSFSTSDCLLMLYFALVRSKLEYASVAWNPVNDYGLQ